MVGFSRFQCAGALCILLLLGSSPLQADRILVIGDSWASPTATALQQVVTENGYPNTIVQITPYWGYASELASPDGLATISAWLDDWPDTTIIHLSTGANDMGLGWNPSLAGTEQEANMLTGVMQNVETVVDHIFSLRPDIRILWSSYDYFRRMQEWTPAETNGMYIEMARRSEQLVMTKKPRMTYLNLYGHFQVTYGFDGVRRDFFDPPYPIPPGDPSLPDSNLLSPYGPYLVNPSHPTAEGYKVIAQAQFDRYYSNELEQLTFHINAGLNDAWFNPATDGQGFFITVFPNLNTVSLAWFTYDTTLPGESDDAILGDPGHRWLTALGPIDGDRSVLTISIASGGIFDTPTVIDRVQDGTITLSFDGCNSGTVEYDIPSIGRQGIVPIQRAAADNIVLCEVLLSELQSTR